MGVSMGDSDITSRKGKVTLLLERTGEGDPKAKAELVDALYGELRRIAARQLRANRVNHTLQPTALVHEAYLKMLGGAETRFRNRAHFFAVAAKVMRQVLVDYARARLADKRGGGVDIVHLEEALIFEKGRPQEILELSEALEKLELQDLRAYQVIELRVFAGLTVEETAEALDVSPRTVKREWNLGRAWLLGELRSGGSDPA
jgi:RNA polymerase sigma factor (TIGR02999 family)